MCWHLALMMQGGQKSKMSRIENVPRTHQAGNQRPSRPSLWLIGCGGLYVTNG